MLPNVTMFKQLFCIQMHGSVVILFLLDVGGMSYSCYLGYQCGSLETAFGLSTLKLLQELVAEGGKRSDSSSILIITFSV